MTSFYLNYFCKDPISRYLRYGAVGFQQVNFAGDTIQRIIAGKDKARPMLALW